MIIQYHHQNVKTQETYFCSQVAVPHNLTPDEYQEFRKGFLKDTEESHPLPASDDYMWLMCNESSPYFLMPAAVGSTDAKD